MFLNSVHIVTSSSPSSLLNFCSQLCKKTSRDDFVLFRISRSQFRSFSIVFRSQAFTHRHPIERVTRAMELNYYIGFTLRMDFVEPVICLTFDFVNKYHIFVTLRDIFLFVCLCCCPRYPLNRICPLLWWFTHWWSLIHYVSGPTFIRHSRNMSCPIPILRCYSFYYVNDFRLLANPLIFVIL